MKSVADIISSAKDLGVSGAIRKVLIAGPIATAGYGLSYGIDSLVFAFTKPMEALGLGSFELTMASLGGMAKILDAGAAASAGNILARGGLVGWLFAIGLVIATMRALGWAFDQMNIDFLSGINVPLLGRFMGTSNEE